MKLYTVTLETGRNGFREKVMYYAVAESPSAAMALATSVEISFDPDSVRVQQEAEASSIAELRRRQRRGREKALLGMPIANVLVDYRRAREEERDGQLVGAIEALRSMLDRLLEQQRVAA